MQRFYPSWFVALSVIIGFMFSYTSIGKQNESKINIPQTVEDTSKTSENNSSRSSQDSIDDPNATKVFTPTKVDSIAKPTENIIIVQDTTHKTSEPIQITETVSPTLQQVQPILTNQATKTVQDSITPQQNKKLTDPFYRLEPIHNVGKINIRKLQIPPKDSIKQTIKTHIPFFYTSDAKVSYWKYAMMSNLKFTQAAFSDNWNGGGMSSVAIGSLLNGSAEYKKKNTEFISEIDFRYGRIWNKGQLVRKSVDRMFIDNRLAYKFALSWQFFSSLSFESQFDNGYAYAKDENGKEYATLISNFMAPGYLTESLGFEYFIAKIFSARIGILAMRQTFVLDTTLPSTYGLNRGETYRNDPAFQLVLNYNQEIISNLRLRGRYAGLFRYKDRSNPNHRLDLGFESRINNLFLVSFSGVVVYDHYISSQIQTSQLLELGVTYRFPD